MKTKSTLVSLLVTLGLLAGNAFAGNTSGYLGDAYPKLQEANSASGKKVNRWISPELSSGKYTAVILENSILYPEPQPTEQVSAEVMQQITAYLDEALRRELDGVIELATTPGPNTMIFKPAITAASAQEEGFQAYELLPVAFIFGKVKQAAGGRAKEATLAMEWQVQDAESDELVGAGMRAGAGQKLKNPGDQVTLENFKPLLDAWAKDARAFYESTKAKK
jgi:Protein of unknown function (DUF3313)